MTAAFKNHVLQSVDVSDYNGLQPLDIFRTEYGHDIKRLGERKAFVEYLKGLPSWLDLPYYYYDIRNLMYSLGYDCKDFSDEKIDSLFYSELVNVFFGA